MASIRIGDGSTGLLLKEHLSLDVSILPALTYDVCTGEVKYRNISSSYNFSNGLTLQDSSIKLGGILNENTNIDVSNYIFLIKDQYGDGNNQGNFIVVSEGNVTMWGSEIGDSNNYSYLGFGNGMGNLAFTTSLYVTDGNATPVGLQYGGDYSDTFIDRSLIDKGYLIKYAEPSLGNPSIGGYILSSSSEGVRSWIPNSTPVSAILDWSTNKYIPYPTKTETGGNCYFYTSSAAGFPDYGGILFLNGVFVPNSIIIDTTATGIDIHSTVGNGGNFSSDEGYTLYCTQAGSTVPSSPNVHIDRLSSVGSSNITSDLMEINDNPTTSGSISGSIFKARTGSNVRIDFNPRVAATSGNAYIFDTHNTLTTSRILSLKNHGTEKFYVDASGNAYANGILLGAGGGTNYNFTNGLTLQDSSVKLGGTLLEDVVIQTIATNQTLTFGLYGSTSLFSVSTNFSGLNINDLYTRLNSTSTSFFLGQYGGSGEKALFTDNRTGTDQTGIEYAGDYSSHYIDRSLIDKGYLIKYAEPSLGVPDVSGYILSSTLDGIRHWIPNSGTTPVSATLDWSTNKYVPYTSKQSGINFYTGTTDPDGTDRLNLNADLHVSMLYCVNNSNWTGIYVDNENNNNPGVNIFNGANGDGIYLSNSGFGKGINVVNDGSVGIYIDNDNGTTAGLSIETHFSTGLLIKNTYSQGAGTIGNMLSLSRTQSGTGGADANFISIIDNPTTSGSKTGKILTVTIDTSLRMDFNPRVLVSGENAYILDTCNLLTTSRILSLRNQGTEKFYVDASGNAYANGILLGAGGGGVTPTDNILFWDTENSYYTPYSTKTQGAFYTEYVMPSHNNPLLYDGKILATEFLSYVSGGVGFYADNSGEGYGISVYNSSTGYGIDLTNDWIGTGVSIYNGLTGIGLNISNQSTGTGISISNGSTGYGIDINQYNGTGIRMTNSVGGGGSNSSGTYISLSRTQGGSGNASGDFISINDSPTTSGTVSGKILSVIIDSSVRMEFNPRVNDSSSAIAYKLESNAFLSTPGSKILSVKNNSSERFKITPTATNIICGSSNTFSTVGGVLKIFILMRET